MKIQVLTQTSLNLSSKHTIEYNKFSKPTDFSEYDINIINLQDANIWKSSYDAMSINCSRDLRSLKLIIEKSTETKVIIVFPFNYVMCYNWSLDKYKESFILKDKLENLYNILKMIVPDGYGFIQNHVAGLKVCGSQFVSNSSLTSIPFSCNLIYEISKTICGESKYKSDFSFLGNKYKQITATASGKKSTTIQVNDNCFLTTLDVLENGKKLDDYLYAVGLDKDTKIPTPDWINDLDYFDDKQ